MQYDEFVRQYKEAHFEWGFGRIDTAEAETRIATLRAELPTLEPTGKRDDADYMLRKFTREISPESQERMARAVDAISAASAEDGTVAERIARAEAGMVAVTRIADESSDRSEQYAILTMNESLFTIIESLRTAPPVDDR